jgi:rod shape-determining protein MreC
VVTSGAAGAFPPGIPVGIVTSVNDTDIRIEPFLQRDRLAMVRIVDYGLSGILRDVIDPEDAPVGEAT